VLTLLELCVVLNLEKDGFTAEVFKEVDHSKDGKVNFCEFGLSMWQFLARDRNGLAAFAFELYDTDDSGALTSSEVEEMLLHVYGKAARTGGRRASLGADFGKRVRNRADDRLSIMMKCVDFNNDGKVSKKEWLERCRKFPQLMAPAYDVQNKLQSIAGGDHYWEMKQPLRAKAMKRPEVRKIYHRNKVKVILKACICNVLCCLCPLVLFQLSIPACHFEF
jgi:Ca2+-binding EF-hand superfamily protein